MRHKHLTRIAVATLAATIAPWTTHAAPPGGAVAPTTVPTTSPQDTTPTATPIKHLVIIFDENVSFDHYFATYPKAANPPGEPAFTAAPGTPSVNNLVNANLLTNNPNFTNTDNGADAAEPFRLDRTQANTADQNHAYTAEQQAYDGGKADLFPKYTGKGTPGGAGAFGTKGQVMGYFDGNTVTALWHYAQHFAMSDNAYTDTYGPSTPGALEVVAGQTNGMQIVATTKKPSTVAARVLLHRRRPGRHHDDQRRRSRPTTSARCRTDQAMMTGKNIGDLLNAAGVTWGGFMGGFDLTRRTPTAPPAASAAPTRRSSAATIADYIPHHDWFQYYRLDRQPDPCRARARSPPSVTACEHDGKTLDPANHEYDLDGFLRRGEGRQLPGRVLLKAPAYQDGHAGYSDPLDEQAGIVELINFLAAAAGLEEHGGDRHLGRFGRLVRPRLRKPTQPVLRRPGRPARRPRQMRHRHAAARRRRQAGERALRPRHAHPLPGDLALGRSQHVDPHPDHPGFGGTFHRGQLAARQAARRRIVRRQRRIDHGHVRLRVRRQLAPLYSRSGDRQSAESRPATVKTDARGSPSGGRRAAGSAAGGRDRGHAQPVAA